MIIKEEMMPLMLKALPSFDSEWQRFLADWKNEGELPIFIALGSLARHLIERLDKQNSEGLSQVFAVIERWCLEGNDLVRNAATVGVLENLQNLNLHKTTKPDWFKSFLLKESARQWEQLYIFWEGKELPVDEC